MNPVLTNRKTLLKYAGAMLVYSTLYGVLFGSLSDIRVSCVVADTLVYWLVASVAGIVVWNMLSYAIPAKGGKVHKSFMIIATGLAIILFTIGLEAIVVRLCAGPVAFKAFASTLLLRIFVTMLAYIIALLYYGEDIRKENQQSSAPAPTEPDVEQKSQATKAISRITVKKGDKIKVIPTHNIIYIQAEGDYVAIVTAEGRWLKEQTMKHFEENLPSQNFVRIHRSYIANVTHITRLERSDNKYLVMLDTGEKIKVSDTGYKILKQHLGL